MAANTVRKLKLGYCPIGNGDSIAPFSRVFGEKQDISKHGIDGCDAVILWGGTDIHPSYYNEPSHLRTQVKGEVPSDRDKFEWKVMNYCRINRIPMIGICRGAQFLCVFAGGKLIQHVEGHMGPHLIETSEGETMTTTSCHHQMMYPWDIEHELLAVSSNKLSSVYQNGWNAPILTAKSYAEPEIVYFPTIRGLAIQGHPEWSVGSKFADYCNEVVIDLLITEELVK